MARSHFNRVVFDDTTGHIDTTATIHVYKPGTTDPIADTIYSSRNGVGTLAQGWTASNGEIDFYLDTPQEVSIGITQGVTTTVKDYLAVGMVYGDDNVWTYGARGDGSVSSADNFDALQEAFDTMVAGSVRYIPEGMFNVTDSTPLVYPSTLDGWVIKGAGSAGNNRNPPSLIYATGSVGAMPAIMAPAEWVTNGATEDTGQSWVIRDLGFWGGGFTAGSVHNTELETTAKCEHGLVLHGHGFKVIDVISVSANGDTILMPGVGMDGSTPIGESHEFAFHAVAARYAGGSTFHAGMGQQDGTIDDWSKFQYGEYCINIEDGPGWSIVNTHPSWGARDIIKVQGAWQCRIHANYVGSVGKYMDGLIDGGGITHYGINVNGFAIITDNMVNDNAQTAQSDPIVGYRLSAGPLIWDNNTFIANAGDDATMLEDHSAVGSIIGEYLFRRS